MISLPRRQARRGAGGQGMMEYGLIAMLIAILLIVIIRVIGSQTQSKIGQVSQGFHGTQPQGVVLASLDNTGHAEPASGGTITTTQSELLLAFVGSDGTPGGQTIATLTTPGVTWSYYSRSNTAGGDAEIWYAVTGSNLTNAAVSYTRSAPNGCTSNPCNSMIVVAGFTGTNLSAPVGSGGVNTWGAGTAPSVSLTTTATNSWVWGIGYDYDTATARTIGSAQTMVHEDQSGPNNDDVWVQRANSTSTAAAVNVTLSDTGPTTDTGNFVSVEIVPTP